MNDASRLHRDEASLPSTHFPAIETRQAMPWQTPIHWLAWGLTLQFFTLNFLLLNYILPALGIALLYLGVRVLRQENRFFALLYKLILVLLILQLLVTTLMATPYLTFLQLPWTAIVLSGYRLFCLLVLRKAVREVYVYAGHKQRGDPLLWLILWQILVIPLAFTPLGQISLLAIQLILVCLILLYRFNKLGNTLDETDYLLYAAPTRLHKDAVWVIYLAVCALACCLTCAAVYHNPPKADPYTPAAMTETREALLALGFPSEVLADLPDETVESFSDAVFISSDQYLLSFTDQATVPTGYGEDGLHSTAVYIERPNQEVWMLQHVAWVGTNAYWEDAFELPMYRTAPEALEGRLLYRRGETNYQAPIPSLHFGSVQTQDFFSSPSMQNSIRGTLSFPFGATDSRAYLLYRLRFMEEEHYLTPHLFNYKHMLSFFRFPYLPSQQAILRSSSDSSKRQHYWTLDEESKRLYHPLPSNEDLPQDE